MKKTNSTGLGMPGASRTHDFVIADINRFIIMRFQKFKVCNSTEVAGINTRRPDISVWKITNPQGNTHDENNYEPIVTIEIAKHRRSYNYSMKAILHAFQQAPSIKESFIYSVYDNTWTKVFRTGNTVQSSKCQTLDLDFANALED